MVTSLSTSQVLSYNLSRTIKIITINPWSLQPSWEAGGGASSWESESWGQGGDGGGSGGPNRGSSARRH